MKKADKIVQKLLRDYMIFTIVLGVLMIAYGFLLFFTLTGHTLGYQIFYLLAFVAPATFNSTLVIRGYKGKGRV